MKRGEFNLVERTCISLKMPNHLKDSSSLKPAYWLCWMMFSLPLLAAPGDLRLMLQNPTPALDDNFGFAVSTTPDGNLLIGAPIDNTGATNVGSAYLYDGNDGSLLLTLPNPTPEANDYFGLAVAATPAGHLLVGARFDNTGAESAGSAYLFDGTTGSLLLTIHNPYPDKLDSFGQSVATTPNGDLFIGAYFDHLGPGHEGAAYLFDGTTGNLLLTVPNPNLSTSERFGQEVAVTPHGDLIVSAPYANDGIVYLFDGATGALLQTMVNPAPGVNDRFGYAVASMPNGDVLVGDFFDDTGTSNAGSVYVFDGQTGSLSMTINNPSPENDDRFGAAVATTSSGDIVVGAYQDRTHAPQQGAVFIFNAQTGHLIRQLSNPSTSGVDAFGYSIAVSAQGAILASAIWEHIGIADAGVVYLFEGELTWNQTNKVFSNDIQQNDYLGWSNALSGDTLAVGAMFDDDHGSKSGSVYVFDRNQNGADMWGQTQKVTAPDANADDYFGHTVALSGNTLVVGATGDDDAGESTGAAYVFERDQGGSGNWGFVKKLVASNATGNAKFGYALDIDGDTIVVGARQDSAAGTEAGAAYVFERNQGGAENWGEVRILTPPSVAAGYWFGEDVAITGDVIAVGAPRDDDLSWNAGAVYTFARNQGGAELWGQIGKFTASDPSPDARFGAAVDIHLDQMIVGSPWDSQAATKAGSAYIFEKPASNSNHWLQVSKVTSSDGNANDLFGESVAIGVDGAMVGVKHADDSGADSGAVYLFEKRTSVVIDWQETQKVLPNDSQAGDYFGTSVAIDGQTISVGAPWVDEIQTDGGSAYLFKLR